MGALEDTYRRSLDDPEGFWAEAAMAIDWGAEPDRILDDSRSSFTRWFPGAALTTCWNAVDRHVATGRAEQPVLVYHTPVTQTTRTFTYRALLREVETLAGRADERFVDAYMSAFLGLYTTGDGGHLDEEGYLFVMGRVDDVIVVAGHRLSTGAIEEVLASHPDVAECAVIGAPDELRGQVPLGLVVLKSGVEARAERRRRGARRAPPRTGRRLRLLQGDTCRRAASKDAIRQDPAGDDASPRAVTTRFRPRSTIRPCSARSKAISGRVGAPST